MPILGRSNHAFFFDGVSDSIVVPQGTMSRLGKETSAGTKSKANILGEKQHIEGDGSLSGLLNSQICIEAWVIPDCGGVVVEKEDQFKLSIGEVDTPGPATFEVFLDTDAGQEHHFISTATKVSGRGYEGVVYPTSEFGGIHSSYNKYNGTYDDPTTLNTDQRPLMHVVAALRTGSMELYINGELMASKELANRTLQIAKGNAHVYVGGKGGQFRGVMESLHISSHFEEGSLERSAPIASKSTLLLYRFEEPIAPVEEVYTFSSISDNGTTMDGQGVTISQISLSTADAVKLAKKLTGLETVSGNYVFSKDTTGTHKFSGGDYKVVNYLQNTGTPTTYAVSHTPYNLLINAGATDRDVFKPNNKPPERVRLHNINTTTGNCLVSSVHLDFSSSVNGLRKALHSRTAGVDNYFVVVGADLLIDSASGRPYQPPHHSTQIIDRTGQMVIDESPFALHGFVYSTNMATDTSDNAYAATWPTDVDTSFQVGHSGRHALNHVDGHDFLKMMPRAQEEIIDQQIDGSADVIDVMYDVSKGGISDQISINSRVDVYRDQGTVVIDDLVNKTEAQVVFDNGLVDAQKEVIAIGGPSFDYLPFMLKGPVPQDLDNLNTETRRLHLRPSEKSRVALLRVPALTSYNLAPFVKVYYNAIDLTGASMSGVSQPLLMVEKTVPAGSTIVTGTTTVFSLIKTAIETNTIRSEMFAAGGYIDFTDTDLLKGSLRQNHSLIGDVSEGYEADDELDESLTPINYKPMTPTAITVNGDQASGGGSTITTNGNSSESTHIAEGDDIYNSNLAFVGTIASGGIGTNLTLTANRAAAVTNGEELYIGVGTNAYPNQTPQIITASHTPTTKHDSVFNKIVIEPSRSKNDSLTDKGLYFRREPSEVIQSPSNGEFDKAGTGSGTHIYEMFDVIDNQFQDDGSVRVFIQPSDRRRVNQLSGLRSQSSDFKEPNNITMMYLMSRARIRAVLDSDQGGDSFTTVRCVGLTESTVNRAVSVRGKGSPDSQVVKEIEPNSPVVTVTLGGPGQGAMDVKPTYDPSPLARLPFSTRRNTATLANLATASSGGGALGVKPLNNNSTDLASWGTYGFPDLGRVYLQDGSSARYDSKDGTSFTFTDASSAGEGKFLLANGTEFTVFADWLSATDIASGNTSGIVSVSVTLFADRFFDESSLAEDGSTINDRMFQGMSDVQHDYQLGTQYASTRAMVEIPFFANQFFDDVRTGTFPGPDNSFKIHIDATHTPHTYNPSPVGRRPKGVEPSDREAMSAYALNKRQNRYTPSTRITKVSSTQYQYFIYVEDIGMFPRVQQGHDTGSLALQENSDDDESYQNVDNVRNYRKMFLASGEWAYYTEMDLTTGQTLLKVPKDSGAENWAFSSGFLDEAVVGASITTGGPSLPLEGIVPIGSDAFTPSSDFENRSEYYHDSASVKTQGGNVDYGLRQYVSAVEFKGGPESNPHAPRIVSGRAVGTVNTVNFKNLSGGNGAFVNQILVTMSEEDMDLFPDLDYEDMSAYSFSSGEFLYEAETIDSTGAVKKFHYYGRLTKNSINDVIAANTLVFVYRDTTSSEPGWVTALPTNEIRLTRRVRDIFGAVDGDDGNNAALKEANNENIAKTYKPTGDEAWTITASSTSSTTVTVANSNGRLVGANTLGLNLRKGDLLYSEETASKILFIGTISTIEDYDDGTYTVTLIDVAANTASAKPLRLSLTNTYEEDPDAILNKSWNYPYAAGGLRSGDTIWANMTINNPYATEGLFAKSRGVFNEAQVWKGFNGGVASLAASRPRESVPLENFLIGDTCLETAINYAQHVNQTVKENYKSLGLAESQAPKVAYVDPYLAEDGHARVLLYDVAHDKEFIAFQDLHMQVQTSAEAVTIGRPRNMVVGGGTAPVDLAEYTATFNGGGPSWITTQIDVANGYPSENRYIRSTQQSKFIESAYSHDLANRIGTNVMTAVNGTLPSNLPTSAVTSSSPGIYGKAHGHHVHNGYSIFGEANKYSMGDSVLPRTNDSTVNPFTASSDHAFSRTKRSLTEAFTAALVKLRRDASTNTFPTTLRDPSTFFDTPDGTRVIPAFLCLKGIRDTSLDLTGHEEDRLQHLKQWTDMDFLRRLSIDCGAVSTKSGVVSIESAAQEIVRQINQAGAPKGQIVVDKDTTGSAHDPAPFWDTDKAFSSRDRGTHMGYVRAHMGREVQDRNGNRGFTVVIHSTVPGASGRNFCVWLDNSKGQSVYQPDFLIGHGGRWRDFWALPEEKEGENMHPAPMPLNKHGRPFAPVTTLTQYVNPDETGEDVISTTDFTDSDDDSSPVIRAISNALGGGQQFNTVNTESFSTIGSSSTIIQGLRVGKNSFGRVNFGGLVASGVPGFSPIAGPWGFGKKGSQDFRDTYGQTTEVVSYTTHTDANQLKPDTLGDSPIYGLKLTDHRGGNHGIRYIYRGAGLGFANDNTVLPDTISNEVCVFFDDRDTTQGGFTIGKHMRGTGDATGRMNTDNASTMTQKKWTGNRWRGVSAPNIAVDCSISKSSTTFTVTLQAPFDNGSGLAHHDVLGYLGFPVTNGMLQVTDSEGGNEGMTFSYTRRTQNAKNGTHQFFGLAGDELSGSFSGRYLISPVLNWTTLVTDELMAAVTTAAINATALQLTEGINFDCTEMYATNGKTFGDMGVLPDAITIRAFDPTKNITPISDLFSASLHNDFGMQAAHVEFGEVEKTQLQNTGWSFGTSRATRDADIEINRRIACGYIPKTVLQIATRSRGPNGNTATPVLVDSLNNPVDISDWRKNLKGESFTRHSGDHILPMINNPVVVYDSSGGSSANDWANNNILTLNHEMWNFLIPAGHEGNTSRIPSFGETKTIFMNDKKFITVESRNDGNSTSTTKLTTSFASEDWPAAEVADKVAFSHWGKVGTTRHFDGLRSLGSVFSEPYVFFRGGKSSTDHSVPLFFGGGFSGVTLDINDGTKNDYSSFYTHPYANGPTGTTGIQNANEISTSFALLDGNAMFAFFPGAALCNQHRGSILPPMFNKDNILSPDISRGTGTINSSHPNSTPYTNNSGTNVAVQKPSPLILRFAHPTARYEDHRDGTDSKTTYIIFGPGQAFPFAQEVADNAGSYNVKQPHPGRVIVNGNGHSKVPKATNTRRFPNHIESDGVLANGTFGEGYFMPEASAYQLARGRFHWRTTLNWETPQGKPNLAILKQSQASGRMYGNHFNVRTATSGIDDDLKKAHPMRHCSVIGHGVAMAADMVYHMDGGYHPGGHWMDNQITFNPPHPKGETILQRWGSGSANTVLHPSAYRVAGPITTKVLAYSEDVASSEVDMEYIIVDATRCQNGEELATVVGSAINTFPGAGALKAMGGTHMPSMSNAMRQDRYGWVEKTFSAIVNSSDDPDDNHITVTGGTQDELERLPASGWLRTDASGFAPYYAREVHNDSGWKAKFYLAPNRITGSMKFEDKGTWADNTAFPTVNSGSIWVWSKAGVHRFNNENDTGRDHMCQTHFSGLVDAIDRTRPIGAVGWAGERYSYLNSLKVGTQGYAAGLGAWHPMLGFSPYGSASSAITALGHLPVVGAMIHSPEASPPVDGIGDNLMTYLGDPYSNSTGFRVNSDSQAAYTIKYDVSAAPHTIHTKPPTYIDTTLPDFMTHPQGVFGRAFIVVSYECESALVAKYDRDGITGLGDWLQVKGAAANGTSNPIHYAGTTRWDERFHGQDRFIAPANAGPNVEAMVHTTPTVKTVSNYGTDHILDTTFDAEYFLHGTANNSTLENAIPSLHKTGDLIFDLDHSVGSFFLEESDEVERNVAADLYTGEDFTQLYDSGGTPSHDDFWVGDVNAYDLYKRSAAKNFSIEHIVWKRMDGGNLSLPAVNARGLGAVPFVNRVSGNNAYTMGEKIYGNVRFTFETTNSAMLPVLQAQELNHPQLASKFPLNIQNVLEIPNEEMQFGEMTVTDDSGQEHVLEGGSPLGTIIRGFRKVTDRQAKGMSPALANSDVAPNLKIQLPDPNSIPGNIVVRSGFDRLQAYQNETMGSGGMIHPDLNENYIGNLFDNSVSSPRTGPTYEDHNWEHIDLLTKDSTNAGWKEATNSAPLQTSYEQHDRTLYFHVTKMGHSSTERYPTEYTHTGGVVNQSITVSSFSGTTLTVSSTVDSSIYDAGFGTKEVSDNRRFLRLATSTDSVVVSYTGISGSTFTGVVGDVDFTAFLAANPPASTTINISPSYYIPAGSNRFFASRRLRDHAEVSGNSPDMAKTEYFTGTYGTVNANTLAHNIYNKQVLTPMPLPRMGHHFVTPTMPMLPGHWAHPAYQSLFTKHKAENASLRGFADKNILADSVTATSVMGDLASTVTDQFNVHDPELAFSGVNAAPSLPSDIHGGAFTLMFETGIKYDGYGILASTGTHAGAVNQAGGHTIVLESAYYYTLGKNFPDPAEVGAYQIVIQPNTFSTQLIGFHTDVGASTQSLTSQQVHTVIGKKVANNTLGTVSLILAQATQADVRGCEVFINEAMLDINPDHGSQFTNIPPLLLYNQFGVEGTESPVFTRRALPYTPGQFRNATPGYTVSTPWWSFIHKVAPDDSSSNNFKHISHHRPDNYYHMKRSTFGSIGVQLTIAGYPSIYPNIYSHILQNTSLNPKCIVKSIQSAAGGYRTITVDDASRFPETPQYAEVLEYTDSNGIRQTLAYTRRSGLQLNAINKPDKLQSNVVSGPFWDNLTVGTVIRLSQPYDIYSSKNVFTDTNSSIFTKVLSQLEKGTRDTTNLHIPDAYLCMWNSNLGRPYTFYSDSSRTFNNPTSDRAVDKKPYNSLPEHFESIHYHDSVYAMSLGPLSLRIKTANPSTKTGASATGAAVEALSGYEAQGGTTLDNEKVMYSKFWPCGSRGGPMVSRLDLYTEASVSWTIPRKYAANDFYYWKDEDVANSTYTMASSGITFDTMSNSHSDNHYSYGWRISLRQVYNKPTYGILPGRGKLEDDNTSETQYTTDYVAGPLVHMPASTWTYIGGDTSQSNVSLSTTYVGIMERQTNFAGMLAADRPEHQVRYSEGRRMTRPFGAPLRTLVSNNNQERDWWGDILGKSVYSLTEAAQYYLVDWWGNERGQEVRRAPVRGFGIRPAWDCGDAYEYDRTNDRTPHARIFNNGKPIFDVLGVMDSSGVRTGNPPRFGGTNNEIEGSSTVLVDVFAPTHSMRIGDMGNGRGVRYPSQFNEDILTELSEPVHSTGIVLSHNTAEPPAVTGLLRPRNDVLQADEIPRGISARLEIAEDGLLKPDAVVSDRVEQIVGTSPHKDAISRSTPRIGIDAENIEGLEKDHIAINTEAHSLHTDRGVGQRTVLHGALVANSQSLGDLDLTSPVFNGHINSVLRFSHTSNVNPLGGSHVLETKSYGSFFDDTGWGLDGVSGGAKTTNPYQNTDFSRNTVKNNQNDQSVKWLLRPVRVLDKQHVEMFRPVPSVGGSAKQPASNFFRASAGGKYGLFTYETPTPRVAAGNFPRSTAPDTNGPYVPVVYISNSSATTPSSKGPKILGTETTNFDKTTITSPVTRMIMSENTLQHYRADASRRRQTEESNQIVRRLDYSVKPRFSQSLHPKGHKGDVSFNVSNHSGDAA